MRCFQIMTGYYIFKGFLTFYFHLSQAYFWIHYIFILPNIAWQFLLKKDDTSMVIGTLFHEKKNKLQTLWHKVTHIFEIRYYHDINSLETYLYFSFQKNLFMLESVGRKKNIVINSHIQVNNSLICELWLPVLSYSHF